MKRRLEGKEKQALLKGTKSNKENLEKRNGSRIDR